MKKYIIMSLVGLAANAAWAQFTQKSSVLDGSGTQSAGGGFSNLSAAGQPGGIAESSGGSYINQAGFLQTFFVKPGLDTDGDGVANEADRDNDNDGLADVTEIGGAAFSPATITDVNAADSDGDGAPDGGEAVAGSNPMDSDSLLELIQIRSGAAVDLAWAARSNKTYHVRYAPSPLEPVTNLLATVLVNAAASPPWYETTGTVTDLSATPNRVFAVEVAP